MAQRYSHLEIEGLPKIAAVTHKKHSKEGKGNIDFQTMTNKLATGLMAKINLCVGREHQMKLPTQPNLFTQQGESHQQISTIKTEGILFVEDKPVDILSEAIPHHTQAENKIANNQKAINLGNDADIDMQELKDYEINHHTTLNIKNKNEGIYLLEDKAFTDYSENESDINSIQLNEGVEETQEITFISETFDDEFPLINMSGVVITPYQDTPPQPTRLFSLNSAPRMQENIPQEKIASYMEITVPNENSARPLLSHQSVDGKNIKSTINQTNNKIPQTVSELLPSNIDDPIAVYSHQESPSHNAEKSALAQGSSTQMAANFRQELTKNEKKAPVLQEMPDIEDVNILQNRLQPTEVTVGGLASTQVVLPRSPTVVAQKVSEMIEHSAVSNQIPAHENAPKTLTYTFHQWKNAPSVTFELTNKTEFVATTHSHEVQQTLQENKYLLSSDKDIYFRQEHRQEREQHQQRQKHDQQEED